VARDLVSAHPEVIIAVGAAAIRAIREVGVATPIVGAFIGEDPIAAGFAASLAHPSGTVTGIVMLAPELDSKRLHILHESLPDSRLGRDAEAREMVARLLELEPNFHISEWVARRGRWQAQIFIDGLRKAGFPE
jgi:hypothetical protein